MVVSNVATQYDDWSRSDYVVYDELREILTVTVAPAVFLASLLLENDGFLAATMGCDGPFNYGARNMGRSNLDGIVVCHEEDVGKALFAPLFEVESRHCDAETFVDLQLLACNIDNGVHLLISWFL